MPDPNEDLDPNEVALPPLPPGPFDPIDLGPLLDLRNLPDIAAVIANPDVKGELPRAEAADKYGSFREDHADPAKEVFTTFFSYLGTTTPRKDREAWADRGYEWVDRLVAFLSQARKTGEIADEHGALRDAIQSIIESYKRMWIEKEQETLWGSPDRHPLAKHFGPPVSEGDSAAAGNQVEVVGQDARKPLAPGESTIPPQPEIVMSPESRAPAESPNADAPARQSQPIAPAEKHSLALAILFEEPEISPTELAKRVGVSRGTLYTKSKKWKAVRETLMARDPDAKPRGHKSDDGYVEAEAEHREFHPTRDGD